MTLLESTGAWTQVPIKTKPSNYICIFPKAISFFQNHSYTLLTSVYSFGILIKQ